MRPSGRRAPVSGGRASPLRSTSIEMSHAPARGRSRALPLLAAVATFGAVSAVAYAGRIPAFVSARGIDKLLHASMGATLTLCLAHALRGRAAIAGVLVLVPLAVDEYLQRYSAARSSDWNDLAADVVGIVLAIALYRFAGFRGGSGTPARSARTRA